MRSYGDGGAAEMLLRCETAKGTEAKQMGARLSAGGRWRDEGALGRVVACADRPAVTRGRFPRHAAAKA